MIIGAGFAGLEAAKLLAREKLRTTVLDQNNHHLFQPLLYQVATAGLSPADIAMPVRSVLSAMADTEVLMARVDKIDTAKKTLTLDRGEAVTYDYLLVATGARHSYFGRPEWEALAPGLKTLEDATDIRRSILLAFEEAERETSPEARQKFLTFVIVGGGPTGIEMAGAIAELARFALARDFKHINPALAKIVLVEASDRLLGAFHPQLGAEAGDRLAKLGVDVRLGQRVTNITPDGADISGQFIPSRTVIWAAGVEPSPLGRQVASGADLDKAGRVVVKADLSVPGHQDVFVCGDLAAVSWKGGGGNETWVPGMAPGAMQEGRHAARNILRLIRGEPTKPFKYVHKGSLATIGRAAAVCDMGLVRLSGFVAWVVWLVVHIFYLIGFRNRMLVLMQWAWSYVTFQRGTRLITDPHAKVAVSIPYRSAEK